MPENPHVSLCMSLCICVWAVEGFGGISRGGMAFAESVWKAYGQYLAEVRRVWKGMLRQVLGTLPLWAESARFLCEGTDSSPRQE